MKLKVVSVLLLISMFGCKPPTTQKTICATPIGVAMGDGLRKGDAVELSVGTQTLTIPFANCIFIKGE